MTPYDILNNPFLNKGSAFTEEERDRLGLRGLLPPAVQTLDEQAAQAYELYQKKASPLQKREYLMRIFSINRTLFFKVFAEHVEEMMPIVYDPVIAESIEGYSHEFIDPEYAVYLTENDEAQFKDILHRAAGDRKIRLIVVTDAEEILGIGDWGANGVDISVGKLMVYTAAAGIDPACVLPVVLDVGTNRKTLLDDPLYLGVRKNRLTGDAYHRVV
ncbi:MAG: NAD-dependent malic enzyme, partial [Selenomonas artemidis]